MQSKKKPISSKFIGNRAKFTFENSQTDVDKIKWYVSHLKILQNICNERTPYSMK